MLKIETPLSYVLNIEEKSIVITQSFNFRTNSMYRKGIQTNLQNIHNTSNSFFAIIIDIKVKFWTIQLV